MEHNANIVRRQRGPYKSFNDDVRFRIMAEAENGGDWKTMARAIGVPYKTGHDWIRKGIAERKKRGGKRRSTIDDGIKEVILSWVEENPQITLKTIAERLGVTHNINVTPQTVSKHLEGALFTVKKVHNLPEGVNNDANKELRGQYVERILEYIAQQKFIIFVDETNFNLFCRRSNGRARRGQRAIAKLPNSKGPNLHIIGGMSSTGIEFWERRRGALRHNDFNDWVRRCLQSCIRSGHESNTIVVVLDNAPAHRHVEVITQEEEFQEVQICRLAPYSFMLNPIEHIWSAFKANVKRCLSAQHGEMMRGDPDGVLNQTEYRMRFIENIADNSMRGIDGNMCLHAYNHVQRYFPAAMRRDNMNIQ